MGNSNYKSKNHSVPQYDQNMLNRSLINETIPQFIGPFMDPAYSYKDLAESFILGLLLNLRQDHKDMVKI